MIDALDTMWLMGMEPEVDEALKFLGEHINFARPKMVSFFETTIRALGGLLSAHDLTGDQGMLDQARALGDRLLPAFATRSGLAKGQVNLVTGQTANAGWTNQASILAEFGTVQVEFRTLSRKTGDPKYADAANKCYDVMERNPRPHGLVPIYANPE